MGRFGHVAEEVEDAVRVLLVRDRAGLEGVDEVRELDRVADEEDGQVVAHEVPVAFLGVELDREPAGVAELLRRALRVDHGAEPHEHRRRLVRHRTTSPW